MEEIFKGNDLVFLPMSPKRAQEGQVYHLAVQRSRDAQTKHEVPLRYEYAGKRIVLELNGRIDSLSRQDNCWCIEEIKTTYRKPDLIYEGEEVHWAQAKAYAAIFALQQGQDRMKVRLLYVHLPAEEQRPIERTYDSPELIGWLNGLCEQYLQKAEARYIRSLQVFKSIEALTFPYETPRAGQKQMMEAIRDQFHTGGQLYIEAPTGIGKTMAALFPALKALGKEECEKIFYLTARSTIRNVAASSFNTLLNQGLKARAIVLWSKEGLCPYPNLPACHPSFCPRAADFYIRLNQALASLPPYGLIQREDILALADEYQLCPHELALSIAEESEVIICDYNHVFDPAARIMRFFLKGGDYALLIDEAHNLVDRAREMFSADLAQADLQALRTLLPPAEQESPEEKELRRSLNLLLKAMRALKKQLKEDGLQETVLGELPPDCEDGALGLQDQLMKVFLLGDHSRYGRSLSESFYACRGFNLAHKEMKEDSALCAYVEDNKLRLRIQNIDPAEKLIQVYQKIRLAVFFSATLQPFEYYDRLLGSEGQGVALALSSPFPPQNRLLAHIPADVGYDMRPRSMGSIVKAIRIMVEAKPGNYLIFFPSYAYMSAVHEAFITACPGIFAPIQEPTADPEERNHFLTQLSDTSRPSVTFAVLGGLYSEGIDLTGDKLIGVAVVGVGLPGISLRQELIRRYHDDRFEDGYGYAYRIPGMNKVRQAVGRLIRTETDQGVALLLDKRYTREDYLPLLPEDWAAVLQEAPTQGALRRQISTFWAKAQSPIPQGTD